VASVSRAVRSFWVWLLGLAVYVTLVILSVYQTDLYGANASYADEAFQGLFGAIVGVCVSTVLMTRAARRFFSRPPQTLRAATPKTCFLESASSPLLSTVVER
jgi:uncharacterized membrane protein YbhN (UPF0104 family)